MRLPTRVRFFFIWQLITHQYNPIILSGNGWQWGPEKDLGNLAVCVNQKPWRNFCIEPPCGQLNPINPNLYTVLQQIYKDIAEMNKEESVIHMGGDEVFFGCWNATAEIINYLMDHNLGRTEQDFLTMWSKFQVSSLIDFSK